METNQATQNENIKTETQNNENEGFDFKEIRSKAIAELKKWPNLLMGVLTKPGSATASLPTKGDWTIPAIYGATAGVFTGVFSAIQLFQISIGAGITALISGIMVGTVGIFVGGAFLNTILMAVSKDPSFYRTIYLVSILSIFSVAGALATLFMPFAGSLASLGYLYVLYFYSQSCAGFTKKQAQILVGALVVLTVLPFLGVGGMLLSGY